MKLLKVNMKNEDFTNEEKRCEVFKDLLEQYQQEDLLTHKTKIAKKLNTDIFIKPKMLEIKDYNIDLSPFMKKRIKLNYGQRVQMMHNLHLA